MGFKQILSLLPQMGHKICNKLWAYLCTQRIRREWFILIISISIVMTVLTFQYITTHSLQAHLELIRTKNGEIVLNNISVVHFPVSQERQGVAKKIRQNPNSKSVLVRSEPSDACNRKLVKLPSPQIYESAGESSRSSAILERNYILVADGTSCDITQKVLNAQLAGFCAIIIYMTSSDLRSVQTLWPDHQNNVINVSFIETSDGLLLSDNYSYPKRLSVELIEDESLLNNFFDAIVAISIKLLQTIPNAFTYSLDILEGLLPEKEVPKNNYYYYQKMPKPTLFETVSKGIAYVVLGGIVLLTILAISPIVLFWIPGVQDGHCLINLIPWDWFLTSYELQVERRETAVSTQPRPQLLVRNVNPPSLEEQPSLLAAANENIRIIEQLPVPPLFVRNTIATPLLPRTDEAQSSINRRNAFLTQQRLQGAHPTNLDHFIQVWYQNQNNTRELVVDRHDFERTYLEYYRDQNLDVKTRLRVQFLGEKGIDMGGPTNEYLSMVRAALTDGGMEGKAIFRGNRNHLGLVMDQELLDKNYYFAAGMAACDIAFRLKYALAGVSETVLEQILRGRKCEHLTVTYTKDDLYDPDVLEAYDALTNIITGTPVTPEVLDKVVATGKEYNIYVTINPNTLQMRVANAKIYRSQLCYNYIVQSRLPAMRQFKKGLRAGGLLGFFEKNPSELLKVFPRVEETKINVDVLKRKIILVSEDDVPMTLVALTVVHRYIDDICEDQGKLKHLIQQWTGGEDLPIGTLRLKYSYEYAIFFSSCALTLSLHPSLDYESFKILVEEEQGFNHA